MSNTIINAWFTLNKDVYVSFNSSIKIILYNTINGNSFITSNAVHIKLIKEVYNPVNLGVVDLGLYDIADDSIYDFIDEITKLNIGIIIEKKSENKPMNFLPILCLQNDIEKLQQSNQEYLIGDNISQYLHSINLIISNKCSHNCTGCDIYYKQIPSCSKLSDVSFMPLHIIKDIVIKSSYLQVKRINILGGNIIFHPAWNDLLDFLQEYDFSYHLWFNLNQINDPYYLLSLPFNKEINISMPFENNTLLEMIELVNTKKDFTFNFLIEDLSHLELINNISNNYEINSTISPIYNKQNLQFFEENVFLEESDILSEVIEMRKIFCNQKLNSNFFGSLYFLPNGEVKANMNCPTIGYFQNQSIVELIYNELVNNTTWRRIRDGEKCQECIYRFLCPPTSNYEIVLKKENLCNLFNS
ncbi:MAG: TIGR04150 pseudo-rSAM protein [Bacteroidales bacterium]|jgi:pseudo-rSAM protein|nr:TIGR04150 pseudo-rSAM protein [Bacteroidales bacterium]